MSWFCWIQIGIFAFNLLFFGTLAVIHLIEKRKDRKR